MSGKPRDNLLSLPSRADHQAWLRAKRRQLVRLLGGFPPKTPLTPEITRRQESPDRIIEWVRYDSEPGDPVTAAVLLPPPPTPPHPPRPPPDLVHGVQVERGLQLRLPPRQEHDARHRGRHAAAQQFERVVGDALGRLARGAVGAGGDHGRLEQDALEDDALGRGGVGWAGRPNAPRARAPTPRAPAPPRLSPLLPPGRPCT